MRNLRTRLIMEVLLLAASLYMFLHIFIIPVRDIQIRGEFESPAKEEPQFIIEKKAFTENIPLAAKKMEMMNLQLLGTIFGGDREPFCTLKDLKTGQKYLCKTGDIVQGIKITAIHSPYIKILVLAEKREDYIYLSSEYPADELIQPISSQELLVKKDKILEYLPELNKLINKIKVTPNVVEGKVEGFKINNIPKASLIEKAGLREGDIIKDVAGTALTNLADMPKIIESIRHRERVKIDIERGGNVIELIYLMP